MRLMPLMLMEAILDIIHNSYTGQPAQPADLAQLELIEIRPRSEGFADVPLSCSVSPGDPADSDGWVDEEMQSPGSKFNAYGGRQMIETGLGQPFNLRFTVDFTLFFQEIGLTRKQSLVVSQTIISRIHKDIILAGSTRNGRLANIRRDDFGTSMMRSQNAVKRRRMLPRGSEEETFYKGKMWLQFEVYMEPDL